MHGFRAVHLQRGLPGEYGAHALLEAPVSLTEVVRTVECHRRTLKAGPSPDQLIGNLAYAVGYVVGTIKWWFGVYASRDDRRKSRG